MIRLSNSVTVALHHSVSFISEYTSDPSSLLQEDFSRCRPPRRIVHRGFLVRTADAGPGSQFGKGLSFEYMLGIDCSAAIKKPSPVFGGILKRSGVS